MNEPKRRGRPSNAEIAAREPAPSTLVTHNGDTHYTPEPKVPALLKPVAANPAQAYAMRVWNGQSPSLGRGTRVARVKAALEGQGLSFDGVKLPGDPEEDEWTAEDSAPVTWRKASE